MKPEFESNNPKIVEYDELVSGPMSLMSLKSVVPYVTLLSMIFRIRGTFRSIRALHAVETGII